MYMNNPNLRAANESIEYTPESLAEWARCKEDILYFAQKYFYIISIDEGSILIPLRDYQKRMLKSFSIPPEEDEKRHRIVLSGRQSGKCVLGDTMIKIRHKEKGEFYMRMKDFNELVKNK